MAEFIKKGIVFLVLAMVLHIPFIYKYYDMTTSSYPYRIVTNYNKQSTLFMGSSHGRDAINDSLLNDAYNISSSFQTLEENYKILSDILQKNKPEKVIISFSPFSLHQTNIQPRLTEQYYFFPHNIDNIVYNYFKDSSKKTKILPNVKFPPKIVTPEDFKKATKTRMIHVIDNDINNFGLPFLHKIIELRNEHGFDLIFYTSPFTKEYSKAMRSFDYWEKDKAFMKELALEKKFDYFDFEMHFQDTTNYYKFFKDPDHLNPKGRHLFTEHFMGKL